MAVPEISNRDSTSQVLKALGKAKECCYIRKTDDSEHCLKMGPGYGNITVMLFTSHDSAQQYLDDKSLCSEWAVVQTDLKETMEWLEDRRKAEAAARVILDSFPACSPARLLEKYKKLVEQ